ncbi:hypothetical protein B0I35DRAFT_474643 [Stachybotrys elegans]|uniref:F-box domain-containing protein n=1 Tax=Stachybotrys elegans TaxID=80388 RepID=A0A8K0T4G0_9HYPO|nr:hypothetical protein B0I35DRAFT_474643 [Stachybotrys elegans]
MSKATSQEGFEPSLGHNLTNIFSSQQYQHRHIHADGPPPSYDATMSLPRTLPSTPGQRLDLDMSRVDPILASAYKNQTENCLLRLVDPLLIKIMGYLDRDDIYRLRHVSRDFLRLFHHAAFQEHHRKADIHSTGNFKLWAEPQGLPEDVQDTRARMHDTIPLCHRCLSWRKDRGYATDRDVLKDIHFFFCAGCKMKHRAFYFSPEQRHKSNDHQRICKGRERRLSACQHFSISWDLVQRLASAPPLGQNGLVCHHEDHRNTSCEHVRNDRNESCESEYPRLVVFGSRGGVGELELELSIATHFEFQAKYTTRQMSSVAFRNLISKQVRPRLQLDSFRWTPLKWHADLPLMLFDPNLCSCLDWGLSSLPPQSSSHRKPGVRDFEWNLCLNPARGWRWRGSGEPSCKFFTGANEYFCENTDRCAGFCHTKRLPSDMRDSKFCSYYKCQSDNKFLLLKQKVKVRLRGPSDIWWFYMVRQDQEQEYVEDEEMRSVLWCPDKGCRLHMEWMEFKYLTGGLKLDHHAK